MTRGRNWFWLGALGGASILLWAGCGRFKSVVAIADTVFGSRTFASKIGSHHNW